MILILPFQSIGSNPSTAKGKENIAIRPQRPEVDIQKNGFH
jgi:hypothetical protein